MLGPDPSYAPSALSSASPILILFTDAGGRPAARVVCQPARWPCSARSRALWVAVLNRSPLTASLGLSAVWLLHRFSRCLKVACRPSLPLVTITDFRPFSGLPAGLAGFS